MRFEVIRDESGWDEDDMVRDLLKAGWLPDVEYVARYEAVAATGRPPGQMVEETREDTSVRVEYDGKIHCLHDHLRNLVAWVEGRVPSPEEARRILDEHGLPGSPATITPDDVTVELDQ